MKKKWRFFWGPNYSQEFPSTNLKVSVTCPQSHRIQTMNTASRCCCVIFSSDVHDLKFSWWLASFWRKKKSHVKRCNSIAISPFLSLRKIYYNFLNLPLLLLLLLSHFGCLRLCATPQTAAHQVPLSLGFSRQEYSSGLPFPSPVHKSEKWKWNRSVVPDSSQPHGLQPSRLLHPWDFPGKSAGVGCHRLLWTYPSDLKIPVLIESRLINWTSPPSPHPGLSSLVQIKFYQEVQGLPWWLRWYRTCLQCGRHGFGPGSGRFPAEGNGNPFQYSCLANSMDRGAW